MYIIFLLTIALSYFQTKVLFTDMLFYLEYLTLNFLMNKTCTNMVYSTFVVFCLYSKYKIMWMAMVQWSAFGHRSRIPVSNPRYPLTTFQYLISPPGGRRLPKLLPYCPQTGLTTLICIWDYSSNKPHTFSTYSRKNVNIRGVTTKKKKSKKNLSQITGIRQSIFAS